MFGEKERSLKVIEGETMTLLDKDAQFEGKLTFDGKVQINGKFRGEIFSEGVLVIGEGAEIDAQIDIDSVIIQGQVNGTIRAKSRIEMHPPAVVKGDIASPGLVISEGAIFEGSCSMGREPGQVLEMSRGLPSEEVPTAAEGEVEETEEPLTEQIEAFESYDTSAGESSRVTEAEF
jgi:cytoskeletal protein CcmA (bactofilin family)